MDHESTTSSTDSAGTEASTVTITVTENGPYAVSGPIPVRRASIIANDEGESVRWGEGEELPAKKKFAL